MVQKHEAFQPPASSFIFHINIRRVNMYNLLLLFCNIIALFSTRCRGYSIDQRINTVIVGGSSGMGKATAVSTVARGGNTLIISRSQDKLQKAVIEIQKQAAECCRKGQKLGQVQTAVLDVTNEDAIRKFVEELPSVSDNEDESSTWDALVFSAAGRAPHGAIIDLPTADTRELFETKFWGAYNCAKYFGPKLTHGGSIVFVGGVLNRRPGINCSPLASTNGALEGLTRALALEFGDRLRVNCLSPGFCETERFDHMDPVKKAQMLANTADSLPLKRTGVPQDMGEAIYHLLESKFITGVVLDCDGGHHIRQYANRSTDPMRKND